jgi:hypothetical protein
VLITRLLAITTLAVIASVAAPSAARPPLSRLDALPRDGERLAEPIWLKHCGMKIVEWRPTSALEAETTPSDPAIALIDRTCREAFARYGDFLRARNLPQPRDVADELPAISILPGNTLLDGKASRSLNDLPSRFRAVAPGCCYWGLYVDSLNHLFLRNDPLVKTARGALAPNPQFVRTLTHEISHILSSHLGVWDAVGYDRQRDEDLAEEFVVYMGMHFPADSSAENLAHHGGGAMAVATTAEWTDAAGDERSRKAPATARANTSKQR